MTAEAIPPVIVSAQGEPSSFAPPDSMLGRLERVLWKGSNRTWTIQQAKHVMELEGYRFLAQEPIASLGVAMKKLVDRGKVSVIMRGSGRAPNVYQWASTKPREEGPAEDLL